MAVRAPDPHNLRGMTGVVSAPVIETDRLCLGCDYNLRGLRAGINCPECGLPSVMPEGIDDPLALMPRRVILAFIWGCWAASICVLGVIGAVIASRMPDIDPKIPGYTLAGLSLLWLAATWLLTPAFAIPQAIFRGFSRASKVRRAALWLQWGWVLAAGCAAVAVTLSSPPAWLTSLLWAGTWIGFLVGMAGIVVLCILMDRLADWTRDEDAQTMFNWAMWGLPIATVFLFVHIPLPFVNALMILLWLAAAALFPYGLIMLSKSVTLSIVHSFEHDERSKRQDERRQQYHDHVGKLVEKIDRGQGGTKTQIHDGTKR